MLIQITSPYFVAGVVSKDRIIISQAAPIVHYMVGWFIADVNNYCKKKNWKYEICELF